MYNWLYSDFQKHNSNLTKYKIDPLVLDNLQNTKSIVVQLCLNMVTYII